MCWFDLDLEDGFVLEEEEEEGRRKKKGRLRLKLK
jgi:hypothetical protein